MSLEHSVTIWLRQLEGGDPDAARPLWERYFGQLVHLARGKLRGSRPRAADEEDVALSAFDSFCRGIAEGRFPKLKDRNNLWNLLLTITERKAIDLAQHEGRLKRGGGRLRGDSALTPPGEEGAGLDRVASPEPTPAFAAEMVEECQRLLGLLVDHELRALAIAKLEGYTNAEIALQLGYAEVTVERRLRLIRKRWEKESTP